MMENRPVRVESEVGTLKRVVLHRPGAELEQLVPDNLSQLLFDDIPYLKAAQAEHDRFAEVLREQGVEVLYLEDLVAETIGQSKELRAEFIDRFIEESGNVARHHAANVRDLLMRFEDPKALVLKTMAGGSLNELTGLNSGPLVRCFSHRPQFVMEPIPNLYFTRDPFASIGTGVSMNHMYSLTRNRETLYGRTIFANHPVYGGKVPFVYQHDASFSIEGGDILNFSATTLGVGVSQRTSPEAVDLLAKTLFKSDEAKVTKIVVFDIPALRAFMHLDTVFTQIDHDKFTVHPEIVEPLKLFVIEKKNNQGEYTVRESADSLEKTLARELGLDKVMLINCGGADRVVSQREQWNDGANTLAISPGKVVVYDRNNVTNEILRDTGITVLEVPSSELSRGRGGPRCMTMPLFREPVVR